VDAKVIQSIERSNTLEAMDVLPNINRTQATERAENAVLSLVTLTFDL